MHLSYWYQNPALAMGVRTSKTVCGLKSASFTCDEGKATCPDCLALAQDQRESWTIIESEAKAGRFGSDAVNMACERSAAVRAAHYKGKN